MSDWREPYRSQDASGSPESAGQVGWEWLHAIIREEHDRDPRGLELDEQPERANGMRYTALYRGTKPLAAYFVVRDQMNFAVLYRWKAAAA
jgi:hypothetical protein